LVTETIRGIAGQTEITFPLRQGWLAQYERSIYSDWRVHPELWWRLRNRNILLKT